MFALNRMYLFSTIDPIKIGVPYQLTSREISELQEYFDSYSHSDLYIKAVRSADPVSNLQDLTIDVNILDATYGYISHKRFGHQVLITEVINNSTSYEATVLRRNPTPGTPVSYPGSSIMNANICSSGMLTSEMLGLYNFGITNSLFTAQSASGSTPAETRIDSCQSAYTKTMQTAFPNACFPSSVVDGQHQCTQCGVGALAGSTLESTAACQTGLENTYEDTLRKLLMGICEVAVVRTNTFAKVCEDPLLDRTSALSLDGTTVSDLVPSYCPTQGRDAIAGVTTVTDTVLGSFPTKAFMVRSSSMSEPMLKSLFYALLNLGTTKYTSLLGVDGIGFPLSTRGTVVTENWGTEACSTAHFQQHSFETMIQAIPGVPEYISCSGCTNQISTCIRGATPEYPLRVAMPVPHSQILTSTIIHEWKAYVQSTDNMYTPVYVEPVGKEYATVSALKNRIVDVAHMSSAQAYLAYKQHKMRILAVELESQNTTGTPVYSKTYTPFIYTTNALASSLHTMNQLQHKTMCTGALLDTSTLAMIQYGLANTASSGMTYTPSTNPITTSSGQSIYSCRSPILDVFTSFYNRSSCATPISTSQVSVCDGCATQCTALSKYQNHYGTLQGIADGICEIALARQYTLDNACGAGSQAPGYAARAYCSTNSSSPATVQLARTSIQFPTVPTDAFVAYTPSLANLTAVTETLTLLQTNVHFQSQLLPLYSYRGIEALDLSDPSSTQTFLQPFEALVPTIPGLDSTTLALDRPMPVDFPSCNTFTATTKGSKEDPILVGVPVNSMQTYAPYFTKFQDTLVVLNGLYIKPVELSSPTYPSLTSAPNPSTGTASNALTSNMVDIVSMDAGEAYTSIQKHGHRVVAIERNPARGVAGFQHAPMLIGKTSAMTGTDGIFRRWSFSDLRDKRVCLGDPNSATAWAFYTWLNTHPSASTINVVTPATTPDACNSSNFGNLLQYFTGGVCAPPTVEGALGDCSICSSEGASCGQDNKYYGDKGALRGVFDNVCDVALVTSNTYTTYCSYTTDISTTGETVTSRPSWCKDATAVSTISESITENWAGYVPNRVWMAHGNLFSDTLLMQLANSITSMNSHHPLISLFTPYEFTKLTTTGDATSTTYVAPGSTHANTVFLNLFTAPIASMHGVSEYIACNGTPTTSPFCASLTPMNCQDKGISPYAPILFTLPTSAWSDESYALFTEYFNTRATHATLPVYVKPVRYTVPASYRTIASRAADVSIVDSLSAYIGWKHKDHRVLLIEHTQVSDAGSYRLTPWVRRDSAYRTFADLKDATVCFGGFESSLRLGTLAFALRNNATTNLHIPTTIIPYQSCTSTTNSLLLDYFSRQCSPKSDGTSMDTHACPDFSHLYYGHIGALRGLAEGSCDVAFARESTYIDACQSTNPQPWCVSFTPRSLTNVEDPLISSTEGLGLYPGDTLLVRPNSFQTSIYPALAAAFMDMARNLTLSKYLPFARGLKLPIEEQYATVASTNLVLQSISSVTSHMPGFPEFIAQPVYHTCPHQYISDSDTRTHVMVSDTNTWKPAVTTPLGSTPTSALRIAVPIPSIEHYNLWMQRFATLQALNISVELTNSLSPSVLRKGEADMVWLDAYSASVGHVRYGQQILAVGGIYSASPTRTYTRISDTVEQEILTTKLTTTTSTGIVIVDPSITNIDPSKVQDVQGLRMCAPNMHYAVGTATHIPELKSVIEPHFTAATAIDQCTEGVLPGLMQFLGPSCAPPAYPSESGICDLCSASNSVAPVYNADEKHVSSTCGPSNVYAGEIGSLLGLASRACQYSMTNTQLYTSVCHTDAYYPLHSSLTNAPKVFSNSVSLKICETKLQPAKTPTVTQPTGAFMVRGRAFSKEVLHALYKSVTMDLSPSLLAVLGVHTITSPTLADTTITKTYTKTQALGGSAKWSYEITGLHPHSVPDNLATTEYTLKHLQTVITSMGNNIPGYNTQVACKDQITEALQNDGIIKNSTCSLVPEIGCNNLKSTQRHSTTVPNTSNALPSVSMMLVTMTLM